MCNNSIWFDDTCSGNAFTGFNSGCSGISPAFNSGFNTFGGTSRSNSCWCYQQGFRQGIRSCQNPVSNCCGGLL